MEAAVRIELTNTGFADPRLTTWLRRHETEGRHGWAGAPRATIGAWGRPESPCNEFWSGKRDSNPRPRPWQGRALPLSYSRLTINATAAILTRRPPRPHVSRRPRATPSPPPRARRG